MRSLNSTSDDPRWSQALIVKCARENFIQGPLCVKFESENGEIKNSFQLMIIIVLWCDIYSITWKTYFKNHACSCNYYDKMFFSFFCTLNK